jgi:hypothetical protein
METDTSRKGQRRRGIMLRQRLPRDILGRTGWGLLALVLLASAGAPKVQAQTTSYDEHAKQVENVIKWASGAWSFVGGLRTVVGFLTGSDSQPQLQLADIQKTVVAALDERHDKDLIEAVNGLVRLFHAIEVEADSVRDSIMAGSFATPYLASNFSTLITDGEKLFTRLDEIMRLPSTPENNQRVYRVTPAYTVLVPVLVSTRRMLGEIDASLKSAEETLIREMLVQATQTISTAAGAYLLYAYEPGPTPPFYFYSPVAEDRRWMWKWPLYAYHYRDGYSVGNCTNPLGCGPIFVGPAQPFSHYQTIPVVKLALTSLEKILSVQPSMVWAENAVIWDLYTQKFAPFVFGWIIRVRQ